MRPIRGVGPSRVPRRSERWAARHLGAESSCLICLCRKALRFLGLLVRRRAAKRLSHDPSVRRRLAASRYQRYLTPVAESKNTTSRLKHNRFVIQNAVFVHAFPYCLLLQIQSFVVTSILLLSRFSEQDRQPISFRTPSGKEIGRPGRV